MAEIKAYRLKEVEEILGVTRRTIYNYIENGTLNAVKVGGQWRVTKEALQKLLDGQNK